MYQIYKTAYQISDEIKLRKENEKPFYWEQIHPEIREKTIEEIDQHLLGAGLSEEKLKEMTKNEKFLAVSEGVYAAELADKTSRLEQLEEQVAHDGETRFLSNTNPSPVNNNGGAPVMPDEDIKATAAAAKLEDEDHNPLSFGAKKATEPGQGTEPTPIKDDPQPGSITTPGQPSTTPATAQAGASVPHPGVKVNSTAIRKDAMVVVKNAVDQMNLVDRDPDSQAALVQSVIDELTKAKESLYK